jgi:methylated-DNA-protein-cysteine methyltransferase-like protein
MEKKNFFKDVESVVALIPQGRVTNYGAIAKYLGMKSSSRMVGWALNQTINSENYLPAHRVVNRVGLLTGKIHFKGKSMQARLEAEGIQIVSDQVQNFDKIFWDPNTELEKTL